MRTLLRIVAALLCTGVGLYPLVYLLADDRIALLRTKSEALLNSGWWRAGFHAHIVCGGVALTVGWVQFVSAWRRRWPLLHRGLGRLYVLMVCVSGAAAVGISPMASTGWIAGLGFGSLGLIWLVVTLRGYGRIRQGDRPAHARLMIYSYSACCAAVTLRLWLPLLLGVFRLDFAVAYPLVAWLSWVPNLLAARVITSRMSGAGR